MNRFDCCSCALSIVKIRQREWKSKLASVDKKIAIGEADVLARQSHNARDPQLIGESRRSKGNDIPATYQRFPISSAIKGDYLAWLYGRRH